MEAFEKIKSGIPEMDQAVDSIRLGDNVVFQISGLDEFRLFAEPFVEQAIRDGRRLNYIRFAAGPPMCAPRPGLTIHEVELSPGFENFTMTIRRIIEEEGRGAFYVFDCLSELQTAWSTDLMMGNFFRVTCPYLFQLDTVAYFPILRGCHSFAAVAKIRDTTQLLLNIYPGQDAGRKEKVYVHPLKIWKRYSPTMFLPHSYDAGAGAFQALTDGLSVSRFYATMEKTEGAGDERNLDSWYRIFLAARNKLRSGERGSDDTRTLCRIMMTRDEKLEALIDRFFTMEDFFAVRSRMIGTGLIGGKACGMLLARKIASACLAAEDVARLEPHDSYYIGADVFYTYIVENNCWELRTRQREESGWLSEAPRLAKALLSGTFPENIRESFRQMLDYYGQCPIIVRSSSILEDGFGNAFAGKYDSVFCDNTGDPEERLAAFEAAARAVYASTMNLSALAYREKRGLKRKDEQMALLVQRVSGSYYGDIFMPDAAGVGYSFSMYKLKESMDPNAGMLRLVMGLGTRAVDRVASDYPRVVNLDEPTFSLQTTPSERHRYSQRLIDVIKPREGLSRMALEDALPFLPGHVIKSLTERDFDAERMFRDRGISRDIFYISCEGLLHDKAFTGLMSRLLKTLREKYEYPVDIEYTVNLGADGGFVVNLLQCRPLQVRISDQELEVPEISADDTYLRLRGASMGRSTRESVGRIVTVDPKAYYDCPYAKKSEAAAVIGEINRAGRNFGDAALLFVPGRIGTSSPELGVPVTFADISEFRLICEISYSEAGYMPELSYGSHMFQDLVESDILYGAVFENGKTLLYDPNFPARIGAADLFPGICPEAKEFAGMIHVYDMEGFGVTLLHDAVGEELLIGKIDK